MFLRLVTRAVLASLLGAAFVSAAPRNAVLIISDDQGFQLGCYGHPVIRTPSLDRLAEQGTRFTHAFATVASCSASRGVILTGMFTHSNGQYGHAHSYHNLHTLGSVRTLPAVLRDAGYRTAIAGKFHVKPERLYPFEKLPCPGGPRNVTAMADAARAFMARESDRPFFLVLGYTDPHRSKNGFANKDYPGIKRITYDPTDVVVPPWLPDRPEVRAELAEYYESISRLDQGIGQVLDAISATGHADDTLIVYISDNGPPWPGAKTTLYDPGVHLPMIVSSPDQQQREVTCHAMTSFVDIAPTILDWAGVEPPKAMAGRSMLPILEQEDPEGWAVVYGSHVFHEITMYYPVRMIRTRRYKYLLNLAHQLSFPFASDLWASPTWQGVLDRGDKTYGRRSVDAYLHRPREELYDLQADPHEVNNLAKDADHAEVLDDLRTRLRRWQEQTSDPWIVKYEYE